MGKETRARTKLSSQKQVLQSPFELSKVFLSLFIIDN